MSACTARVFPKSLPEFRRKVCRPKTRIDYDHQKCRNLSRRLAEGEECGTRNGNGKKCPPSLFLRAFVITKIAQAKRCDQSNRLNRLGENHCFLSEQKVDSSSAVLNSLMDCLHARILRTMKVIAALLSKIS